MHFRVDSYDSAKNAISRTLELIFSNVGSIQFDPFDVNELSFDCKYGVDGAQSRSNLTHHFQVEGRSDSNLVLVAMVPLSLSFHDKIYGLIKSQIQRILQCQYFLFMRKNPQNLSKIQLNL